MYVAITTKNIPATDTKPARISIKSSLGKKLVSRPDVCVSSIEEEHRIVVREYLDDIGHDPEHEFVTGILADGSYAHVLLPKN